MIKTLNELSTGGTNFNLTKATCDKRTGNVILSGKKRKAFPSKSFWKSWAQGAVRCREVVLGSGEPGFMLGSWLSQKRACRERAVLCLGDVCGHWRGGELRSAEPVPVPCFHGEFPRRTCECRVAGTPPAADRGAGSEAGSELRVLTTQVVGVSPF